MRAIAVIPARYASTRFPGKPLATDTGKYLIQHVYERVCAASSIAQVIVATDDERIAEAVRSFGGAVAMTRTDHPSGSDRVAEAASGVEPADVVVNVQGDEPEIEPGHIDRLVGLLVEKQDVAIATLACPFAVLAGIDPRNANTVKVVLNSDGNALYFSRAVIPHPRMHEQTGQFHQPAPYLLHLGIYAFRSAFLADLPRLAPTPLERTESLEQLRWLEHGYAIAVGVVDKATRGVDTPEDYAAFVARLRESNAA
jgi:3-deoxy-manno-octulosonate cytidylyltransferase (CMP-KDO synthetase)